jgi:hypothetical protein
MAKKVKQEKDMKDQILSKYMEYVLENGKAPESVYQFCKVNAISEEDFYNNFGSFEGIDKSFWEILVHNTVQLITKDKSFLTADIEEQTLTFYYTLFENMLINRSYILLLLSGHKMEDMVQLRYLRKPVVEYFKNLPDEGKYPKYSPLPDRIKERVFLEQNWLQFLTILRFWLKDSSPKFEKTDALIEKSVRAASDLKRIPALESIVDLGKFLYNESSK